MSSKHNVIVMGASAGGIETLLQLLSSIDAPLDAAIFIVQLFHRIA